MISSFVHGELRRSAPLKRSVLGSAIQTRDATYPTKRTKSFIEVQWLLENIGCETSFMSSGLMDLRRRLSDIELVMKGLYLLGLGQRSKLC